MDDANTGDNQFDDLYRNNNLDHFKNFDTLFIYGTVNYFGRVIVHQSIVKLDKIGNYV